MRKRRCSTCNTVLNISLQFSKKRYLSVFTNTISLTQGPFDGIIGFSTGAAIAANLVKIIDDMNTSNNENLPPINQPPFKFFLSISGFRWPFKEYDKFYPIPTPSLHVIGQTVFDVQRSLN